MKFAHFADCHIGGWRDPKLKELPIEAFRYAVYTCIDEKVDFILIAGDLFNTALPGIDFIKRTMVALKKLKEANIPVYIIAGSHDYSPSGKTMLDILEEAGLITNVFKGNINDDKLQLDFTVDEKTGAKITGVLGRRGTLEKKYFEDLDVKPLEKTEGFKIFMFHTAIDELKPEDMEKMESTPASFLPKHFDYYAGGHVHIVNNIDLPGYKHLCYPGPLFPNSFSELEKLKKGGFYLCEVNETLKQEFIPVELKRVHCITVNAHHKSPAAVEAELMKAVGHDFKNTIVLIRVEGVLSEGRPSSIDFKVMLQRAYDNHAFFVMKNTAKLRSKEFEEIKTVSESIEQIEEDVIQEHAGQVKTFFSDKEKLLAKDLLQVLQIGKHEGEKVADFEKRLKDELDQLLDEL